MKDRNVRITTLGEDWPSVEVTITHEDGESKTRRWIAVSVTATLAAFVIYGFATSDKTLISDSFDLVKSLALIVTGWYFGRRGPPGMKL